MGTIVQTFETEFDKGQVVVFKRDNRLLIGLVESCYVDMSAGQSIWYNIRTGKDNVYTYSNGGDIGEFDILLALEGEDAEKCKQVMLEIEGK